VSHSQELLFFKIKTDDWEEQKQSRWSLAAADNNVDPINNNPA